MFDSLSDKLQNVMKKIKGQTRISEKELKEMLREVKLALLKQMLTIRLLKISFLLLSKKL